MISVPDACTWRGTAGPGSPSPDRPAPLPHAPAIHDDQKCHGAGDDPSTKGPAA